MSWLETLSASPPSSQKGYKLVLILSKLDISQRASLVTSTIIKDISKGVAECSDSLSSFINLDLLALELDLMTILFLLYGLLQPLI